MICPNCNTPIPENSRYCLECGVDTSDPGTGPRPDFKVVSDQLFEQLRAAVVERYDLAELLGRGGMGAVFLATDRKLERPVALKVLPPELSHDAKVVERFEREARTAAKLDHPNIIPIYSVESHGDFHYFVMKFVTGKSLEDILGAGRLPIDLTQRILWEAACALGHAHRRGIVHRDIKPANIMVDDRGSTVLTDFGISKAVQSATHELTATGQVVGTPHYMSPEQSKGVDVGGASDQYSLAVVGFRMLTGKLPFEEDSIHAVLYKKLFEHPPWIKDLREDLPDHLAEALHKALAREPQDRYSSMEAFATAVWPERPVEEPSQRRESLGRPSRADSEAKTTQIETKVSTKAAKQAGRGRRFAALSATLVVLSVGSLAAWYLLGGGIRPDGGSVLTAAAVPTVSQPDSVVAAPIVAESSSVDSTEVLAQSRQRPPDEQPETTVTRATPPSVETQQSVRAQPRTVPTRQQPAVPTVGYVRVDAQPFATVWIDGVEIQDTPLPRHELPPGQHIVELRREGYQTVVDTILVTAGNTLRKRYPLVRKP
jgi:serine/threonine protein kinase